MKRVALLLASSLLAVSAMAADSVATLSFSGSVMVNQGKAFVAAQSGQPLMAGDRVMVPEGGSATLTFADGCSVAVEPGSLVSIPSMSTCAGGAMNAQRVVPKNGSAVGSSGAVDWGSFFAIVVPVLAVDAYDIDHHPDRTKSP